MKLRLDRRGPRWGLGGTGEKGHLFQGNRGTTAKFEGNRGTKTILGNREHNETNVRYLGNKETSQFILGEQGSWYHNWEGPTGGEGAEDSCQAMEKHK